MDPNRAGTTAGEQAANTRPVVLGPSAGWTRQVPIREVLGRPARRSAPGSWAAARRASRGAVWLMATGAAALSVWTVRETMFPDPGRPREASVWQSSNDARPTANGQRPAATEIERNALLRPPATVSAPQETTTAPVAIPPAPSTTDDHRTEASSGPGPAPAVDDTKPSTRPDPASEPSTPPPTAAPQERGPGSASGSGSGSDDSSSGSGSGSDDSGPGGSGSDDRSSGSGSGSDDSGPGGGSGSGSGSDSSGSGGGSDSSGNGGGGGGGSGPG